MRIIKKNIFLFLTIALTLVAILPLLHHGFFPMHDNEQVARLFELNYDVQSLHLPPRLSQNLGFGYDYPFFNFYPSFVYYIAEIFVILGFGYITSIKIMIAIGFIFSAIFMYLFSRKYAGDLGGLVAAILYTYAPYHSIDVYVRGALPEFFSFVFVPAIFWGMERLSRNQIFGNIIFLGLFGAGLMLTHNLVLLMSAPFILAYFLFTLYKNENWKQYTVAVVVSGIISILLSAYFWIPAILENKYTMVNLLTKELADYHLHFVSIPQFVNSAWGYGGSILGPADGFSLEVGKLHLILILLVVVVYVFYFLKKKIKTAGILFLFLGMFIFSVFIQSYYSTIIWDNIKALSYIQFPWRFMLYCVFTSSFIAGYLFVFKFNEKIKIIIAALIIAICLLFYGGLFKPESFLNVTDADYTAQKIIRWKTSAMAFEYVPAGIKTKKSDLSTTVIDIDENEIAKETATPLSEDTFLNVLTDKPQYKKFEYQSKDGGEIQVNTFSFPGWKVFINGKQIGYNDMNRLKLITISVPKGRGIVEAKFSNTNTRQIANLLSLLGIVIVVLLIPISGKKVKI